ncbi:MAG: winged helix-turn-helix domain-containing protein [Clostridiales bacterium]|jgi:hypothetical protein|nr:winged helix-turn-helix domain-containing protein [Clostridiales bacterium]
MTDTKLQFLTWLNVGNTKKYSPAACIANLEEVSEYALSKKIAKVYFFEITDHFAFNKICSRLLSDNIFRHHLGGKTYTVFKKCGKLYFRFLKEQGERLSKLGLGEDLLKLPELSDMSENTAKKSTMIQTLPKKRTIADAIVEVLKNKQPLFTREIYHEIIDKGLYQFGAVQPLSVVYNTIKSNCLIECDDKHSNKKFKVVIVDGKNKFALSDFESSLNEKASKTENAVLLDWNDRIAINFQTWIIQQGKAEATARSYRDAMNFIVKNFSKDWAAAKNQANAILGLQYFYSLIKGNGNFIASNKVMHNAYIESIKEFYLFLSKDNLNNVQKRQVADNADTVESVWKWNGENDFTDTKPTVIKTKLSGEVLVKSWKDVLRYIYEYANKNYPKANVIGQKNSQEGLYSPCKLTNGLFIETQCSTKQIMAKCKRVLAFCGENLSDIEIMFQKKLEPQTKENDSNNAQLSLPESITEALKQNYYNGFKFDATAIRLLIDKSGITIDSAMQKTMKSVLYRRKDDLYFLLDSIATPQTREKIVSKADNFLAEYDAFELQVLLTLFESCLNKKIIRNVDDFESFYDFINREKVRFLGKSGKRLARSQNVKSDEVFSKVIKKTYEIIAKSGGYASEWDICEQLNAFSSELIEGVIKDYANDIIRTEIGNIPCYVTLAALNIPNDFSEVLSRVLNRITYLELVPTEDILHTLLSSEMGNNFKKEYGIPDNKTFRQLIVLYYKDTSKREWKGGIYTEVSS